VRLVHRLIRVTAHLLQEEEKAHKDSRLNEDRYGRQGNENCQKGLIHSQLLRLRVVAY
jgi:hypothetical protein